MQGRATARLRHDKSGGTLGKMIQSVRLPRQQALFLPFDRLFVFVWPFTRPARVLSCFSPLPHKFSPAAFAPVKFTAAPLFNAVVIHHSRQFPLTRANDVKQTFISGKALS